MGLLSPKKGAAAPTGRTRPSRAELLMAATQELAADQLPDAETMSAIEGGNRSAVARGGETSVAEPAQSAVSTPPASASGATSSPGAEGATEQVVRSVRVDGVRPSPFQPKGRPSGAAVEAVRRALAEAGSLAALVSPEGAVVFGRLSPEAARLAELSADVATHGVREPIEVRSTDEEGVFECLSGHRRLAAARLAGHATVPALDRGSMSNASAAATVLRGNLHRENFTTWQEAVLVSEVQERRRHDGYRDNVRTLGMVMGWSHGKVNMLLRIRRALDAELLGRTAEQVGVPVLQLEEQLARSPYRDLERIAAAPDPAARADIVRRVLGLADPAALQVRDRLVCVHRPKRGGGFLLEVHAPVETLAPSDAAHLQELLEAQLARVKARLGALEVGPR